MAAVWRLSCTYGHLRKVALCLAVVSIPFAFLAYGYSTYPFIVLKQQRKRWGIKLKELLPTFNLCFTSGRIPLYLQLLVLLLPLKAIS